jgi:hypothetical protein
MKSIQRIDRPFITRKSDVQNASYKVVIEIQGARILAAFDGEYWTLDEITAFKQFSVLFHRHKRHCDSQDLHRTGCSLFCGAAGRDNQAVLRRVLLGFARWNKSVGYCQGLNVLAALVLQVMDRAESSAVKVMIYLIEGVLPEGYFADNLRGLSVDMAVFRDLLRSRLPKLSKHLEALQNDAKDKATGE